MRHQQFCFILPCVWVYLVWTKFCTYSTSVRIYCIYFYNNIFCFERHRTKRILTQNENLYLLNEFLLLYSLQFTFFYYTSILLWWYFWGDIQVQFSLILKEKNSPLLLSYQHLFACLILYRQANHLFSKMINCKAYK